MNDRGLLPSPDVARIPTSRFSACIELLFAADADSFGDRVRLAHRAGLTAVEFWRWSNKDLAEIAAAAGETGLRISSLVAEPVVALTDPGNRDLWLDGLRESIESAQRLKVPVLIAQTGNALPEVPREEQRLAVVRALQAAVPILRNTGIRLGVEPLNVTIDHKGYFLSSTEEALDMIDEVGAPEIGIIYDVYHSAVMGETTRDVLADRVDRVVHVHVADHPGRNEPGSGEVDLAARLRWLIAGGYAGYIGLEYRPLLPGSQGIASAIASLTREDVKS